MTLTGMALRLGIAGSLAISGLDHAHLYIHGYRHIPTIGTAFLIQASLSIAVAILIVAGGPAWLRWAAAVLAAGSLGAFALSRTIGLFGFSEAGWQPAPHAAISALAEALTVVLCAAWLVLGRYRGGTVESAVGGTVKTVARGSRV
jgi:hypothetical protein